MQQKKDSPKKKKRSPKAKGSPKAKTPSPTPKRMSPQAKPSAAALILTPRRAVVKIERLSPKTSQFQNIEITKETAGTPKVAVKLPRGYDPCQVEIPPRKRPYATPGCFW